MREFLQIRLYISLMRELGPKPWIRVVLKIYWDISNF